MCRVSALDTLVPACHMSSPFCEPRRPTNFALSLLRWAPFWVAPMWPTNTLQTNPLPQGSPGSDHFLGSSYSMRLGPETLSWTTLGAPTALDGWHPARPAVPRAGLHKFLSTPCPTLSIVAMPLWFDQPRGAYCTPCTPCLPRNVSPCDGLLWTLCAPGT